MSLYEFRGIQRKFAEMGTQFEAARLLTYRSMCNADKGLPSVYDAAMAKLACNRADFEVADQSCK